MNLDSPKEVRQGEELDVMILEPFLKERLGLSGELKVSQFPGGFSNLTYSVELGTKSFVLRRPPFGVKVKSAHDMSREFKVLSALHPVFPKAPKAVLFCDDPAIMDAPFYLMERVKGVILRGQSLEHIPSAKAMQQTATAFIATLVELHAVDYAAAGLNDLGRPEGYVSRQISGWTRRYENAKTDDAPDVTQVALWLAENQLAESSVSLIHNDFKYDNIVLDPLDSSRIIAVLDWEMTTVGDPLMDLGTSLSYWVEQDDPKVMQSLGLGVTTLEGNPNRKELIERYEDLSGRDVKKPVFYYVYGLFKLAGILQQIYARYKAGYTQDKRFASLIDIVHACTQMAETAIEKDSV